MIYAQNFFCSGTLSGNVPVNISTSSLSANTLSNINFTSPVSVDGNITTTGTLNIGKTKYATYLLNKDITMNNNEYSCTSDCLTLDETASGFSENSSDSTYDITRGVFIVPMDGLYNLDIQGSFSNIVQEATNGVYFYFQSDSHPKGRIAPVISSSKIVSTSRLAYLLKDEVIQPIFYSSDPHSTLISSAGETFVGFTILHGSSLV